MLDGKELKPAQFKRLSAVDKEKIAKQLASFITSLHATPGPIIRKFKVQPTNVKKNYNALVRNARKLVFPKLKKNEIKAVEIFFDELKIVLKQEYSNTLIHTDLKWEHLLWNNKKKRLNIIDFSDREFGDPAIDFTSLWIYGNKFTHRVYELYNGKKDKEFLYRSQLYFKKIPILVMQGVVEGYPLALKKAHNMFKQRFKI
jgi:aminoglycoside phosphotransferase (APT) family kinase protein